MTRVSAGKVRTMRGRRCFNPETFLFMALPREHTLHPFVVRSLFND
jgi:hypothetical protein